MSSVHIWRLARSYLDRIQESPTLDLVRDCLRFVAGYFEVISASSAHIYHSALVLAPQESIVRQIYESHSRPFTRVIRGAPTSWDPNNAAASRPSQIQQAVWSPCSRFVAIAWGDIPTIDVLDSVTLQRLQSFRPLPSVSMWAGVLIFSPDGRILTYHGIPWEDHELCVSSWDLQTGGLVSTIGFQGPVPGYHRCWVVPSIAHSTSEGIVGVFHLASEVPGDTDTINIFICDVTSGTYTRSLSVGNGIPLSRIILAYEHIWTYGESFRFATADAATVTIWEVGFTLDATCMEVETLRTPVGFVDDDAVQSARRTFPDPLLTHAPGDMILLACSNRERILVWDVRNSKCLLDCEDARPSRWTNMSFSSDGRFFVYTARPATTYIWKVSPTGYVLHGILPFSGGLHNPLLSPNGESIVTLVGLTIRLWRTREITTPPSGSLTGGPQNNKDFLLDFSPDETLAAAALQNGKTVTVLNLESGVPQLTIDVGMEVYGLRVIGNTVVVVGGRKVISWNLPAGDCVPDARVDREDSARTVNLSLFFTNEVLGATISSDFRYAAVLMVSGKSPSPLRIYSASTGELLQTLTPSSCTNEDTPWLTPDGSHVWCVATNGEANVLEVGKRGGSEDRELVVNIEHPPEGYPWVSPWVSSRGYRVMNDWWILGLDGKRLLMLPPPWQSYPVRRVWKGKFLALLHGGLSEPVILEMEP